MTALQRRRSAPYCKTVASRVLIVDDDAAIVRMLARTLAAEGFDGHRR